jgi:hypothetical protein
LISIFECEGCKKRKAWIGRRGFIGSVVGLIALAKVGAYQLATGDTSLPFQSILGLVRMLNTIQAKFWIDNERYASEREMLVILLGHLKHTDPNTIADTYMSRLNIDATEIVPGWDIDFDGDNQGYILSLIENVGEVRYALVTDEQGMIFWTKTDINHPRVHDLQRAKDFPNSSSIDDYNVSHEGNFRSKLKAVAWSIPPDLCTGCPGLGCVHCIQLCCKLRCTGVFPPPSPCFFNCGGSNNCVWAFQLTPNRPPNPCQKCAHNYYGICCTCMP